MGGDRTGVQDQILSQPFFGYGMRFPAMLRGGRFRLFFRRKERMLSRKGRDAHRARIEDGHAPVGDLSLDVRMGAEDERAGAFLHQSKGFRIAGKQLLVDPLRGAGAGKNGRKS